MRDVDFVNNISIDLFESTNIINIVHLENLYNFKVQYILIRIVSGFKMCFENCVCRVFQKIHSANNVFAECIFLTLGKEMKNTRQTLFFACVFQKITDKY